MNPFDSSIIAFLNSFAHRSEFFDTFMHMLSDNQLLKGGVIVTLIWCTWFRPDPNKVRNRQYLLCGIVACLVSIVVARTLANTLPYRERPLRNPAIHFQLPYGESQVELIDWSSFPSDHATVFFALATAIFFAWRAAGIFAFCHAFLIICLPRVYLGFHHPTDILAGALMGVAIAAFICTESVRGWVTRLTTPWLESSPGTFYACLFVLTYQIADIFESIRFFNHFFVHYFKTHV